MLRTVHIDGLLKASEAHEALTDHGARTKHHPIECTIGEDDDAAFGRTIYDGIRACKRGVEKVEEPSQLRATVHIGCRHGTYHSSWVMLP